ncbi:MAG TPA: hypothetical protein PKD85_02620 [Saprospiraceae bacterium]|nr:hypothetical protein [Saprospiraceae bacterium]
MKAQEAGATLYTGLINGKLHQKMTCDQCNFQSGYTIGLDGRLNSGGLFFLISGDFIKFDLLPINKIDYFSKEKMTLLKLKAGMGFKIISFSKEVFLSSKIQLVFSSIYDYNQELLFESGLQVNDGFLGATSGLMLNYKALIFELEFEKGLLNMFYEMPQTKTDFITLKTGFKF